MPSMEWVRGLSFIAVNLTAALALYTHMQMDAGQALGVIALFYVFMLPCVMACAFFIAPYAGGRAALAASIVLSVWLAWSSVMNPGVAPEIDDPATCFDKQGAHPC